MDFLSKLTGYLLIIGILAACGSTDLADSDGSGTADTDDATVAATAVKSEQPPATAAPTVDAPPATAAADNAAGDPAPTPAAAATVPSYAGTVPAPEFPTGLDWLNTGGRPLTMADLRGKIVLLDFWTYGCINCIHVIPDLKRLEEKYAEELVVIGVHSAKFENEAETENIRNIILRYELEHPVVNDNQFEIWNTYGARAWPTFVLIDPAGNVLGFHSGEGIYEPFDFVIGEMVAEFDALGQIDRTPLSLILEKESRANSPLLFPGKVLADEANNRLFIADSNHNRIVVTDLEGRVQAVIGNGRPDLQDGNFETASFFRPQGLALAGDNRLYVADTENHAIRRVDLASGLVETVAGTGEQGSFQASRGPGPQTALNSPWDVLYLDGILYIAMAGQHQLWLYDPATMEVRVFAGSGREELVDGPLARAGLNQPSGLATDGQQLFFADSEASAIRAASLAPDGPGLQTIVGTGLFDFGDVDGIGSEVRLQHPLGVTYQDGLLYVADTYNSKIKRIDPETGESMTWLGGEESGWQDGNAALFDEPGGLSITSDRLYIADTNNHVVRVASLASGEVETLVLVDMAGLLLRQPADEAYSGTVLTLAAQTVAAGAATIQLDVLLPAGYKFNEIAPFTADFSMNETVTVTAANGIIQRVAPTFPLDVAAVLPAASNNLQVDLVIYYCEAEAESLCFIEQVRLLVPLVIAADGTTSIRLEHTVPDPAAAAS